MKKRLIFIFIAVVIGAFVIPNLLKGHKGYFNISYYPNGRVRTESYYDGDRQHVKLKEYYDTGELKAIWPYFKGTLQGDFTVYHPNGKVASQWRYLDGQIEGAV